MLIHMGACGHHVYWGCDVHTGVGAGDGLLSVHRLVGRYLLASVLLYSVDILHAGRSRYHWVYFQGSCSTIVCGLLHTYLELRFSIWLRMLLGQD